jgi:CheY-like chemotaxis protein
MKLNILFIEDEDDIRRNLVEIFDKESIAEYTLNASSANTFEEGINMIKTFDFDIIILDLFKGHPSEDGEKLGFEVLKQIQATAFVPVIFYSGLTKDLGDYVSEVVGVVNKGDGIEKLKLELERIISSNLALIKPKIYNHIKEVLRQYFWETVHSERKVFPPDKIDVSLGYLLLRRIANSLSKENIKTLLNDTKINPDKSHPMEFYIYPPANKEYEAGEILLRDGIYYVILTPSCDFAQRKVENVLLAVAKPLKNTEFYKKYESNKEKFKQGLSEVIESRKGDRYFFLPGTPFIDNHLLDFQHKTLVNYGELKTFTRIAKLDDPYAQSMISSFIRYYNRIGFPDIDAEYVLSTL